MVHRASTPLHCTRTPYTTEPQYFFSIGLHCLLNRSLHVRRSHMQTTLNRRLQHRQANYPPPTTCRVAQVEY
ncbi:hypothetical protein GQ44DRAFT_713848 [Phaeosphaeriaceae sp. PMI808]|nr:hypothetical protein GQ44DRAFT_713848 [Phaeosphaeriaceae sp. PMI808]